MHRLKLHMLLGVVGLTSFLLSTNGFEIYASVVLANTSPLSAMRDSIHYTMAQPIGTLLLAIPFFVISSLAAELAIGFSYKSAGLFLVVFLVFLYWLYFLGYWGAQYAMLNEQWTSSALSIGMLPFKSIPILFVAGLVVGIVLLKSKT